MELVFTSHLESLKAYCYAQSMIASTIYIFVQENSLNQQHNNNNQNNNDQLIAGVVPI